MHAHGSYADCMGRLAWLDSPFWKAPASLFAHEREVDAATAAIESVAATAAAAPVATTAAVAASSPRSAPTPVPVPVTAEELNAFKQSKLRNASRDVPAARAEPPIC